MSLYFRKDERYRGELERLVEAENECCNVEGVQFRFEEQDDRYLMRVYAPADGAQSEAVSTVLENFAEMPRRSSGRTRPIRGRTSMWWRCLLPGRRAPRGRGTPVQAKLFPDGHYHSPYPCLPEIRAAEAEIFDPAPRSLPAVTLNESAQLALLDELARFYPEMPFRRRQVPPYRYYFDNPTFSYADGIILYSMLRHFKPRRLVEAGSGYSSALALDVNEHFLGGALSCTFIEPHPERLRALMKPADEASVVLLEERLQQVDWHIFSVLEAGDVLFIDSTHVAKVASDVNHLFFEVLPRLQPGVLIHFHDIFYPFEYPKAWVYEGRAWSEAYLLRAFLQYNRAFEVLLFNHYLALQHTDRIEALMPLFMRNSGGSLWLRKLE